MRVPVRTTILRASVIFGSVEDAHITTILQRTRCISRRNSKCVHKHTSTKMFIVGLFLRVKNQKQPQGPSTEKWINNGIFIQWFSIPAIKMNEPKITQISNLFFYKYQKVMLIERKQVAKRYIFFIPLKFKNTLYYCLWIHRDPSIPAKYARE